MRRSLGTAVFSGMLGVTLFGIFLTPVFFYVIQGLGETQLFLSSPASRLARLLRRWAACSARPAVTCWRSSASCRLPWAPIVGAIGGSC